MKPDQFDALKKHVAGATVQLKSPFDQIQSFQNKEKLSKEFIEKWVAPFDMKLIKGNLDEEFIKQLCEIKLEITPMVIEKCLGDFNWRSRQTGAFFAAITNQLQFVEVIGTHLLKSELTYAGKTYCRVLAFFNTPNCVEYIEVYLRYYLKRPDLFFDQQEAMTAIKYLDKVNHTDIFNLHLANWIKFVESKQGPWKEEINTTVLEQQIQTMGALADMKCD